MKVPSDVLNEETTDLMFQENFKGFGLNDGIDEMDFGKLNPEPDVMEELFQFFESDKCIVHSFYTYFVVANVQTRPMEIMEFGICSFAIDVDLRDQSARLRICPIGNTREGDGIGIQLTKEQEKRLCKIAQDCDKQWEKIYKSRKERK